MQNWLLVFPIIGAIYTVAVRHPKAWKPLYYALTIPGCIAALFVIGFHVGMEFALADKVDTGSVRNAINVIEWGFSLFFAAIMLVDWITKQDQ